MALPEAHPGRLAWRCRRGMKELDVVLTRWLEREFPAASPQQQAAFAEFLELPDPELVRYLLGGESPADPRFRALVAAIGGSAGAARP